MRKFFALFRCKPARSKQPLGPVNAAVRLVGRCSDCTELACRMRQSIPHEEVQKCGAATSYGLLLRNVTFLGGQGN